MSFRVTPVAKEAMTRLQSYLQTGPRDTVVRAVELMASVIDADEYTLQELTVEINEVKMRYEAAKRVIELRAAHEQRLATLEAEEALEREAFERERAALLATPEQVDEDIKERLIAEALELDRIKQAHDTEQ
jgi:hypothetical protein